MRQYTRDYYRAKLERLLGQCDDESLLRALNALIQLRDGNPYAKAAIPDFPDEGIGAEIGTGLWVPSWTIENLANELLCTPKGAGYRSPTGRVFDVQKFNNLRILLNYLHKLENAHDGIALKYRSAFTELHRIWQRQQEWQRGYENYSLFYRSGFLYAQGEAKSYFLEKYGYSIEEFVRTGFCLAAQFRNSSHVYANIDLRVVGISHELRDFTLRKLAVPHLAARTSTQEMRSKKATHIAYKPSIFRDFPIIRFGEDDSRLVSPIPTLIFYRITRGLYRDIVQGGSAVWNEIGKRFELYCLAYLQGTMIGYDVAGEFNYGSKKRPKQSPDIIVRRDGEIVLICECKSKAMTFAAKFSNDPIADAALGYNEIARGISQIWRFKAESRASNDERIRLSQDCVSAVITVEPWLAMSHTEKAEVYRIANRLADKLGNVPPEVRDAVAVCQIDDVEQSLRTNDPSSLINSIRDISVGEKQGWLLPAPTEQDEIETTPYPFFGRLHEIYPWWAEINEG